MTKKTILSPLVYLCIALSILSIFWGKEIRVGVLRGIEISWKNIIPTLFPFFILSDLWSVSFEIFENSIVSRTFKRIFGIPGCCLSAFLSGVLFGFPLGVKTACKLYDNGCVNKKQLSTLCGFSNNPSMAFVVSGIGVGILGSIKKGIMLFFACVISAVICGMLFRNSEEEPQHLEDISGQRFDLTESIKGAGLTSLVISSFIIFFSAIITPIGRLVDNQFVFASIASLLEVSSAVDIISKLHGKLKILLLGFALGFSGLSVHLQSFSILPRDFSKARYLLIKAVQGLICALLSSLLI